MAKDKLRTLIKQRLADLSEQEIKEQSKDIFNQLMQNQAFLNAKSVFIYLSMPKEINTAPIIKMLLKRNVAVLVPKIEGNKMLAVYYNEGIKLKRAGLGILEPVDAQECATTADVCIVPCVALSKSGARLGYGKGYYDRFLKGKATHKIGVCLKQQLVGELPMNENDVFMDCVLVPKESK